MKKGTAKGSTWGEIGKKIGTKLEEECKDGDCKHWQIREQAPKPGCGCGAGGAVYGLGFLGALYYYITTATSLWMGIVGVLKAIFWPAFLVYGLMKYMR